MEKTNPGINNLVSLVNCSPEQRQLNTAKAWETKRRKKERIESAAGLAIGYLNSKTKIKEDGKTVTKSRSEFLFSMVDQIIAKRDRTSVEMMKVLFDAVKDNPTLIQQINFNQTGSQSLPVTAEEREKDFNKLMGYENKAEDVEYSVTDD